MRPLQDPRLRPASHALLAGYRRISPSCLEVHPQLSFYDDGLNRFLGVVASRYCPILPGIPPGRSPSGTLPHRASSVAGGRTGLRRVSIVEAWSNAASRSSVVGLARTRRDGGGL